MHSKLSLQASSDLKADHYREVFASIQALLANELDWVAAMATVVCELHHAFAAYDWTGFYRVTAPEHLKIGPYQGGHGCLDIPFSKGVCGAAARTKTTQLVADVHQFEGHIACSSSTLSEIVVPALTPEGHLLAVLDVDSNAIAAFDLIDQQGLETLCAFLGQKFSHLAATSTL